jgi:hypothetical protein
VGFDKHSDKILEIKTIDEENILKLSNFFRFGDDSCITFDLLCRSNHLEIRNFNVYADFNSFNHFIYKFKKIYNELLGEASIDIIDENDTIKIIAQNNGWIKIHCKINNLIGYDPYGYNYSEYCQLEFSVDQTYLCKMINEIDLVYKDLELI